MYGQNHFFDAEPWMKPVIEKSLSKHSVQIFDECLSDKHLPKIKDTELLVVFIYSKVSKDIIKALPKLKFVATTSTGFDHIDVKACQDKKITVCNVPFYGENTVAEHAMALILSISRLIPQSVERTRSGEFSYAGLRGFDLKGQDAWCRWQRPHRPQLDPLRQGVWHGRPLLRRDPQPGCCQGAWLQVCASRRASRQVRHHLFARAV